MKKRLLGLFLCIALVMTLLPVASFADGRDPTTGIENPGEETRQNGNLHLTKNLSQGSNNTYDITMKSWATGEVKAVTEKVPTDFVVIVDQSGSMATTDMPIDESSYTLQTSNTLLRDAADGYYFYKDPQSGQFYRVYGKRGYLYQKYDKDNYYANTFVSTSYFRIFQTNENDLDARNLFFYRNSDGSYNKSKITIRGAFLNYECYFYRVDGNGNVLEQYGNSHLFNNRTYYSYRCLQTSIDRPITGFGMSEKIQEDMYRRHMDYTGLFYRDVNGVEHALSSTQGVKTAEFCDKDGNATSNNVDTIQNSNAGNKLSYSGLYELTGAKETRLSSLETALNAFAGAVANETDDYGKVDNRIALVGFSSDPSTYNNTELLTGVDINYSSSTSSYFNEGYTSFPYYGQDYTPANSARRGTNYNGARYGTAAINNAYGDALMEAAPDTAGTVNPGITKAIKSVTASGGTQPEDGFEMAEQIFKARSNTTYEMKSGKDAGQTVDRNKVVIFFTDGEPGNTDKANRYEEANEVVEQALDLKHYVDPKSGEMSPALVFTIGVFSQSDGNPLTYVAQSETEVEEPNVEYTNHWSFVDLIEDDVHTHVLSNTTYDYSYLFRQWRADNPSEYGENANDTIFDYMSVVSSNYPDAEEYITQAWLDGNHSGTYSDATDGIRHKSTAEDTNKYYRAASSQDTLVKAFLDAITMSNEETETQATLDNEAVFHDAVNLEDFDASGATYKVEWQPMKWENGAAVEDGDPVQQGEPQAVPTDGVIDYSGFNYSADYTTENHPGKQLVITISGLKPKTVSRILESNDGNATITGKDETTPTIEIETPTLDLRDKYFAVHHILVNKTNRNLTEEDITLYPISGNTPFNITNKLLDNDNYLYGGVYEGFENGALGDPMTFGNDTGLSFTPVAGTDYYLKEVPTDYLRTKILWRSSGPNMAKSYLISTLDSEVDYCRTGFIVDGENQTVDNNDIYRYIMLANGAIAGSGTSGTKVSVYISDISNDADAVRAAINEALKTVPVNADGSETEDFSNRDNVTIKEAFQGTNGFLSMYEIPIQSQSITGKAFWVTHDGLMVTGNNIRTVVNGRATANNEADVTITPYSENAVNYEDQLNLKALFVGADDTDEEEPTEDDGVKLAGYTTSLNGNIAMNFYLDLSDEVAADKDAYMQFTLPGGNHTEEVVSLADAKKQVRGGKTYYVFSAGVAAKDMTSDIKAQFVRGDGTKSDVWTYTIKAYCDYIRNHPDAYDEESVALVENMLNYGGYAQTYFKHNTDKMANADLDLALPEVDLDASFDPVITGEVEGLTYKGSSAMLTTTTGLRHYFELAGSAEDYTFKANGKELEVQSDKSGSYVLIDNIKAKDLKKPIALTVTDKNGNTFKLSYSVYTNIKQVTGDEQFGADSQNLMKALYGYSEAAIAYFAAHA